MAYDITGLKRKLIARYPWFGGIIADTGFEETDAVRTLAGDGKNLRYNAGYLEELTGEEQLFVFAHELCHIAFNHIYRSAGKDQEVWKAATDAVVNQWLKRDGLPIARGGIDYPEAIDYDAEAYYEILLKEKLEIELVGGQAAGQGGSGGGGHGQRQETGGDQDENSDEDDHSLWEAAAQDHAQKQKDDEEDMREQLQKLHGMSDEIFDLAEELEDGDFGEKEDQGEDEQDKDEDQGIVSKTVSQAGNAVNPDTRKLNKIGQAGPVIDWRLVLRDTITYGVDWSFTNATIEDGIVRPALEERPMPETEIVLDTSWSVDDVLLRNFLRECKNILQLSKLRAGCFDTVFYGFQDIRTAKDIDDMVLEGGGGTDFDVAAGAFTLRVDNRIVFTDGEAPMPKEPLNAIWMVYGEEEIAPPGGTVIRISPEQLERLRKKPEKRG